MNPSARDEPILEARDLIARYGDRTVLAGINLTVRRGDILTILGGSGCGKTTLLRHLIGLAVPASGQVLFLGHNLHALDDAEAERLRRRMGVLFQGGALFGSLTVEENVALPLVEHLGMELRLAKRIAQIQLSLVEMQHAAQLLPGELSGGMRKRAGLARALALDPEILFFDEPSAGLDPITSAGLDQLILRLNREMGMTIVVVTHELPSIFTITRTALMLDQGRIAASGSLEELQNSPNPRVRQFLQRQIPDRPPGSKSWIEAAMVAKGSADS
ncbi:MAG: ATP-binding cassette domain-containing protein [Planctomycetes bacterium]|nr:ATP-binding cassette domain-containing protein [Planctomycetota bacterium]